jgi:4-amino-4-deoxy-L-arabinose transferase-like glycosyltransferase
MTKVNKPYNYFKITWIVVFISFIIRIFFAHTLEFGNDEVYYWLLAKYPSISYFDHPPMFAWFINLFSFGLNFDSELGVRLSSIIVFSINTLILFSIGKEIKNSRTGFIAALLYQSSIYSFVITGIMIIPDTPLSLFWLLAMRSFIIALRANEIDRRALNHMILAGIFTGLAVISKYNSLILWAGAGAYILFHKREWFKKPHLYIATAISISIIAPILLANGGADSSNVSFQTNRISLFGELKPLFFMREFLGQLIYNNPINVVLAFIALFSFRKQQYLKPQDWKILLWFGLPILLVFLFFSLFSATLPHWSAPGYYAMMLITAAYLDQKSKRIIPTVNTVAIGIVVIALSIFYIQINHGKLTGNHSDSKENLGKNDVTLDLYGWSQISNQFMAHSFPKHPETKTIIAKKWFNAAHLDYYVVRNNNLKMIALGDANDIHEYLRINALRGGISPGDNAWFIAVSRNYVDPYQYYANAFESIQPIDTLAVYRNNKVVEYAFVFYLKNYQKD